MIFKSIYFRWKHRNDTSEQRHERFIEQRERLIKSVSDLRDSCKDDPETQTQIQMFSSLDEYLNILEDKK